MGGPSVITSVGGEESVMTGRGQRDVAMSREFWQPPEPGKGKEMDRFSP